MTKPITKTRPWDAATLLETDEDVAAYLDAVLEDGDPALLFAALGDVARAKGMTRVARRAGLGRESLYKALTDDGNPAFATVHKVVGALGLRFQVVAAQDTAEDTDDLRAIAARRDEPELPWEEVLRALRRRDLL